MSRKNKAARAYFHQNPDATPKDAWDEAWAKNQSTFHAKSMQNLEAQLKAEREKVRVLRDGMREIMNMPETFPDLDGYDWFDDAQLIAKNALQATAPEQEGE